MRGLRICALLVLGHLMPLMAYADVSPDLDCSNGRVLVGFKPHLLTQIADKLTKERKVKGSIGHRREKAAELVLDQAVGEQTDPNSDINLGPNAFALNLVDGEDSAQDVIHELETKRDIRYVECDAPIEAFGDVIPNDPYYFNRDPNMWGLRSKPGGIDTQLAWNITKGSSDVVVAVIDTGIDYNHPDLAANMWHNPGETPGDRIDNDGNGYVDDIYGVDRVNYDSDPWDDHSHGTHCSGTIGAVGNNGVGVVGVNWTVRLMAVKVLSSGGSGSYSGIAEGVDYVVNAKLRGLVSDDIVMSASLGGSYYSTALRDALARAQTNGILLAAAAGNSALNINRNSPNASYPASFSRELSNIVSVASITSTGALSGFSNYGDQDVHIAGPGSYILSTVPNNGYATYSGTSMATPHVAGTLALMLAANPTLTMAQLRAKLLQGAFHNSQLDGYVEGGRMLDANGALLAAGIGTYKKISGQVASSGVGLDRVTMSLASTANLTRVSDSQGNYSFEGLLTGANYTVTPSSSCATFSPLAASGTIGNADLVHNFAATLTPLTISGLVRDPGRGNVGISGVVVTEVNSGRSATTDSNGSYALANLTCGAAYNVTAVKSGYTFAAQNGFLDNDVALNLIPSGATYLLSGVIIDANRDFLPGVSVTIRHANGSSEQLVTDAQGRYSRSVTMPDTITITPSKGGYSFLPEAPVRVVVRHVTQDFLASAISYTISGNISANGSPLSGVTILGNNGLGSVTTDSSGNYRFEGISFGQQYTVTPSDPRYIFVPASASGTVSNSMSHNFSATVKTFALRGNVQDDVGNNLSGVRVTCGSQAMNTGADGNFALTGMTYNQSYNCSLSKVGYIFTPAAFSGTISADLNVSSIGELQYYSLSGVVLVNGQPLQGVTVTESRLGTRVTGANGAFLYDSVAANTRYTLRASKDGTIITPGIQTGVVVGPTVVDFGAVLSSVTVGGAVTYNGQPLSGVLIQSSAFGSVMTDANGRYDFGGIRGGTNYVLYASKSGYTFSPASVTGVANGPVTHNFSASGRTVTISGRLVAGGQPVAGITVNSAELGSAVSGSDGTFTFLNVVYGTKYDLRVQSSGYTARGISSQVALADRSHTITLTANRYTISGRVFDGNGRSLARAVVNSNFGGKRVTGTNGAFTISAVPYNFVLNLKPEKKGVSFETVTITVTGNRSLRFDPR